MTESYQPYRVLRVQTSRELIVKEQLDRMGAESIVPKTRVMVRDKKTHRPAWDFRPLFSSYVFARYDSRQRGEIANYVSYFLGFLRFGDDDAIVYPDEMERINLILATDAAVESRPYLTVGQSVKVIRGCMTGLVGDYVRTDKEEIVVVNLPYFGRSVATPLPWEYVEAID